MPRSVNKKVVSCDKDIVEKFDYLYPRIKEIFCNRALKLGCENKEIFELIFFNPIFKETK